MTESSIFEGTESSPHGMLRRISDILGRSAVFSALRYCESSEAIRDLQRGLDDASPDCLEIALDAAQREACVEKVMTAALDDVRSQLDDWAAQLASTAAHNMRQSAANE